MSKARDLAKIGSNLPDGLTFRNKIINGGMGIWQRGTTYTGTGAGASQFGCVDRWAFGQFPTAYSASRSTDVPSGSGLPFSLKIQRIAGQTSTAQASIIQAIESVNMLDLAGKAVTLSFWAKAGANYSTSAAALGVIVTTGTVADQGSYASQGGWTGQAYPVNTTQTLTTSWQRFTFTSTFGSTALEAAVYFYMIGAGTAGADDSVLITGVQLEAGTTATGFEYRPYGQELVLCQRYYWRIAGGSPTNYTAFGAGGFTSTANFSAFVPYPVQMRAIPTFSIGTGLYISTSGFPNVTAIDNNYSSQNSGRVQFNASSGTAGFGGSIGVNNATTSFIDASAEL